MGGNDFVRDRDTEFGERQKISKDALLIHLSSAVKETDEVLTSLDPARLLDTTERTPKPSTYMSIIGLQLVHYSTHAGQIVYATKRIRGNAIDDLWRTTPTH